MKTSQGPRKTHKSLAWVATLVVVTVALAMVLAGNGLVFSHTALAAAPDM